MAPEVLSSSKYDIKADLWSVGTILYQMLVGVTPYQGDNYIHLLENIKKKRWVMPPEIQAKISTDCMALLTRLLQKDPKARMDHAEFMAHPFLGFEAKKPGAALKTAMGQISQSPPVTTKPAAVTESDGRIKISPGLPPRLPPAPGADPRGLHGADVAPGGRLHLGGPLSHLGLERELSCGSDDEFVLVGTPPATPPLRVAWRGAELDGEGVKLVRQNSLPEGFGGVMGRVNNNLVNNLMDRSAEGESMEDQTLSYLTSQATVVMELANAMVQHSPRDALALYVKCLKLLDYVVKAVLDGAMTGSLSQSRSDGSDAGDEAKRLFLDVFSKAEKLASRLPPAQSGLIAEELLYECALAMGREAASCEILNDTAMARKHYGCAFVCLNLLKSESKVEADRAILAGFIKQVEQRSRDLAKKSRLGSDDGGRSSDDESSPSPIHTSEEMAMFPPMSPINGGIPVKR